MKMAADMRAGATSHTNTRVGGRPSWYSRWLIIAFFAGLILSGPPRLRKRALEAALDSPLSLDPAALLQVVTWLGAGAVAACLLIGHFRRRTGFIRSLIADRPTLCYLMFGCFGFASMVWSSSPFYTAFSAGKLLVGILLFALLVGDRRWGGCDRAMDLLFLVFGLKACALMALFFGQRSLVVIDDRFGPLGFRLTGGDVLEDYGTSAVMVGIGLLSIALFGETPRQRRCAAVGYVASWVPLLLSQTRTSILPALLAFPLLASLRPVLRSKLAFLATTSGVLMLAALGAQGKFLTNLATRGGDGFGDLTGRADAFSFLMPIWRQSPLYGLGYGSGTRGALIEFLNQTGLQIGAGHDVLSTVLVDTGLIGAFLLLSVYLLIWARIIGLWRRTRADHGARVLTAQITCVMLWVTMQSVTGQGIHAVAGPFLAVLATAWALDLRLAERAPVRQTRV